MSRHDDKGWSLTYARIDAIDALKAAGAFVVETAEPVRLTFERSEALVRAELRRFFDGGNVAEVLS